MGKGKTATAVKGTLCNPHILLLILLKLFFSEKYNFLPAEVSCNIILYVKYLFVDSFTWQLTSKFALSNDDIV